MQSHFKSLPFKFDIIYLDFCGTVDSSETFSVIKEVFNNYKLNSPGVLITNFALPDNIALKENKWNNIINLCANYLYPKQFTEKLTNYGGGYLESAETNSITPEEFIKKAFKNYKTFYSQFITRVLFDLPTVLIPYQRFVSDKNLIDKFFKKFSLSNLPNDRWEDIINFPNNHSLEWGLNDFIFREEEFDKTLSRFIKQLEINPNKNILVESVELMEFFKNEDIDNQFNSDILQKIADNWQPFRKYIFCDVFLFHQLKDVLISQLTNPYFYNVEKTFRWTYKAKKTRMFMDLVTYDECRYIFDWMPTLDMFEAGINNLDRQLTLRFAMDGIAKQRRWYNDEFFSGTAVIGGNIDGFEAKILKKRKVIN